MIIDRLKKYINGIKVLEIQLKQQTEKATGYEQACLSLMAQATPELVIQKMIGRGLKWFDYSRLPVDKQRDYYLEAQRISKSEVFNNELNSYLVDITEEIATRSKDFDQVLRLRVMMNFGEVLRERLAGIKNPDATTEPTKEDIYSSL